MKYLKNFANAQDAEDYIDNFNGDYNILASVEGSSIVGIIKGIVEEPAPDEIWYMTKNGNIMDASMFASYKDTNYNTLSVTSNTLVGDHYVVKFSDNIYRINYACSSNSELSWIFIPSTVSEVNDSACSGIDDTEENVRYIGDKTVYPGNTWPWDILK